MHGWGGMCVGRRVRGAAWECASGGVRYQLEGEAVVDKSADGLRARSECGALVQCSGGLLRHLLHERGRRNVPAEVVQRWVAVSVMRLRRLLGDAQHDAYCAAKGGDAQGGGRPFE